MNTKRSFAALCMAVVLATSACAAASPAATTSSINVATATQAYWATALATRYWRASPTATATLGATQASLATALATRYDATPTYTPTLDHPPIPGIDTPIIVYDVALTFKSVRITQEYAHEHIQEGYSFLVLSVSYEGNLNKLFDKGGPYYRQASLYIAGAIKTKRYYMIEQYDRRPARYYDIVFFLKSDDRGPYTLHDPVTGLEVPLGSLPTHVTP